MKRKDLVSLLGDYNPQELEERLLAYPGRIQVAKQQAAKARLAARDAEADRQAAEAELVLAISVELNGAGKPRFANAEARAAELARQKSQDEDYRIAAEAAREAEWAQTEAQGELDRLFDEFRALRMVARLVTAELALWAEAEDDPDEQEDEGRREGADEQGGRHVHGAA